MYYLGSRFSPREDHAGFMVDRTYFGRICFQNFGFPSLTILIEPNTFYFPHLSFGVDKNEST
jgi:hypothetical protein